MIPAALSLGTITAVTPAASARKQAPRLCGSVTPSSTRNNVPAASMIAGRSLSLRAAGGRGTWRQFLVARATGHAVKIGLVARVRLDSGIAGALGKFAHSRVLLPGLDVELKDVARIVVQCGFNGVDADQQFGTHGVSGLRWWIIGADGSEWSSCWRLHCAGRLSGNAGKARTVH